MSIIENISKIKDDWCIIKNNKKGSSGEKSSKNEIIEYKEISGYDIWLTRRCRCYYEK